MENVEEKQVFKEDVSTIKKETKKLLEVKNLKTYFYTE